MSQSKFTYFYVYWDKITLPFYMYLYMTCIWLRKGFSFTLQSGLQYNKLYQLMQTQACQQKPAPYIRQGKPVTYMSLNLIPFSRL